MKLKADKLCGDVDEKKPPFVALTLELEGETAAPEFSDEYVIADLLIFVEH